MRDVIKPVRTLMDASDQAYPNIETAKLYRRLITEEYEELIEAENAGICGDEIEEFDACLDMIYVIVGYMLARGWLIRSGWGEVVRSNLAKIDPVTGKVIKREDGKVLKPEGWTAPNLGQFLR